MLTSFFPHNFRKVFSLVQIQHQFDTQTLHMIPYTYVLRLKTCYLQGKALKYPCFVKQYSPREQCTRLAKQLLKQGY